MNEPISRQLPSADWLAFGIGVAALFLHYLYPPLMLVVAVAVFAPSVLRELGILTDADEWTRSVMHRAGFHAVLVTALFIFLRYLMPSLGFTEVAMMSGPEDAFGGESLRKAVVWVFLISYLLQYWGPRTGAFRILLGVAVMNAAPVVGFLKHANGNMGVFVAVALSASAVFVALAFLARSRPRFGGWLLLTLCAGAFIFMLRNIPDPRVAWGAVAVMIQAFLILGVTGIALVRDPR